MRRHFGCCCSLLMGMTLAWRLQSVTSSTRPGRCSTSTTRTPVWSRSRMSPVEEQVESGPETMEYLIGPGDVLSVSSPAGRAIRRVSSIAPTGFRINTAARSFLPHRRRGGGHRPDRDPSPGQAHRDLQSLHQGPGYHRGDHRVQVTADLPARAVQHSGNPVPRPAVTQLLHGVALAGGLASTANLRGARLVRKDRIQPVDIYELMYNNDLSQNVPLRPTIRCSCPATTDQRSMCSARSTRTAWSPWSTAA